MADRTGLALHDHPHWPKPAPATHRMCTRVQIDRPFWQYGTLLAAEGGFLLDSAMNRGKLGRHSYLGDDAAVLFTARRCPAAAPAEVRLADCHLTLHRLPDGSIPTKPLTIDWRGDPFVALRDLLALYRPCAAEGTSGGTDAADQAPFQAGAVGYIGFEAAHFIEALPDTGIDDLGLPDIALMLVDSLLVHDHNDDETRLICTGRGRDEEAARQDAARLRNDWLDRLRTEPDLATGAADQRIRQQQADTADREGPAQRGDAAPPTVRIDADLGARIPVRGHCDRALYCRSVEQIREHIRAGDVFEVCLTQRLEADLPADAWSLYHELRRVNPAPFASFLRFSFAAIVSASPERFLALGPDRSIESRPIKGTRPRGATAAEDARLRAELAAAEKDRAENVMIVDLVRNDLGRVARIGSVAVPELCLVESYATVFQLVSSVRAELADGHDAIDLLRACFPGGSMTGAPKIESLCIIDRLEAVKRGVYAGAIGWFDLEGAMDLGMVIRTVVCRDNKATFGVGGAVTADSDPQAEYEETLDKARALVRALERLHQAGEAAE